MTDIVSLLEELRDVQEDRHAILSEWARSPSWHSVLMICEGWQGELAREAYQAREADLASPTVGKAWFDANPDYGRASIYRLLEVELQAGAQYATLPFRVVRYDEQDWIGGAVGFRAHDPYWTHLDIEDVVLWSPRTGETRLYGDVKGDRKLVLPDMLAPSPVVYADGRNFMKAWAAKRFLDRGKMPEAACGNLPGILAVGGLNQNWASLDVQSLLAGPGVDKHQLGNAVMSSARLPSVEEARFARA